MICLMWPIYDFDAIQAIHYFNRYKSKTKVSKGIEASLFLGWGGGILRKSLYLSRTTLFMQTISYCMCLSIFPEDSKNFKIHNFLPPYLMMHPKLFAPFCDMSKILGPPYTKKIKGIYNTLKTQKNHIS